NFPIRTFALRELLLRSACGIACAVFFSTLMYSFAYQARDASGRMTAGIQEALNEDNAINTLMSRGLMVLSIQQKALIRGARKMGKVGDTDLVLFTRQLATMVDAGLPLV